MSEPDPTPIEQELARLEAENASLREELHQTKLQRDTLKGDKVFRETYWQDVNNQITQHVEEKGGAIAEAQRFRVTLEEVTNIAEAPTPDPPVKVEQMNDKAKAALSEEI